MKTILVGFLHLKWLEKGAMLFSIFVAIGVSYLGLINGAELISSQTIGPLVLMWAVIQSTIMTGVMRLRQRAMNHLLTTCLVELREVRANPGQHVPTDTLDMVAKFLGDKK